VELWQGSPPASRENAGVTYGPYLDVAPRSRGEALTVLFESAAPLLLAPSVTREVEVRLWGWGRGPEVVVSELYELRHGGARLRGGFSRADFAASRGVAVRTLRAALPPGAAALRVRDALGNVSRAVLRAGGGGGAWGALEVEPRYPLLGGWNASLLASYRVGDRAGAHVRRATLREAAALAAPPRGGDVYLLSYPLLPALEGAAVESYALRIVLPQGARMLGGVREGLGALRSEGAGGGAPPPRRRFGAGDAPAALGGGRPITELFFGPLVTTGGLPQNATFSAAFFLPHAAVAFPLARAAVAALILALAAFLLARACSWGAVEEGGVEGEGEGQLEDGGAAAPAPRSRRAAIAAAAAARRKAE
jgi:hypothetical protein